MEHRLDDMLRRMDEEDGEGYESTFLEDMIDECDHSEWHWDGQDKVCSICGRVLSGIDYAELDRIERAYEAQQEAEADSYEPDEDFSEEMKVRPGETTTEWYSRTSKLLGIGGN